jgi:hypothetical protein
MNLRAAPDDASLISMFQKLDLCAYAVNQFSASVPARWQYN